MKKEYIGDGVYAEFDGYQIWLSTQEGMRIALDEDTYAGLERYEARLRGRMKEPTNEATS